MEVAGWASTMDVDHSGDIMLPSSFARSIATRGISGPKGVKLLAYHNKTMPIGKITKLEVRNRGLWLEGKIDTRISYAADLAYAVETNAGLSYSVGFRPINAHLDDANNLVFTEVELMEVSIVLEPCCPDAVMVLPKSHDQNMAEISATLAKWRGETCNPLAKVDTAMAKFKAAMKN